MKANECRKLAIGLLMAALVMLPILGQGQNPFPSGQARETVIIVCSQCHVLTRITESNLNAEQWEFTLYDMIARGAPVHEKDVESVRRYLVDNFATDRR